MWVISSDGGEPRQVTSEEGASYPEWSSDGNWIGFYLRERFFGARLDGSDGIELLVEGPGWAFSWSPDGESIYYVGTEERPALWEYSLEESTERRLTDLVGRRGQLSYELATDGRFLYFTWEDELADIWVMDVEQN